MKVKIIKLISPSNKAHWPQIGEVLIGRKIWNGLLDTHPQFQCTEGKWSGLIVPFEHFVEAPSERTYSTAEYDYVKGKLDAALSEIVKRGRTIRDLEAREAKKVPLPREVAEAIEKMRLTPNPYDNAKIIAIALEKERWGGPSPEAIRTIPMNDLISALVNGYTVEPLTTEDKIKERLSAVLIDSGIDCPIPVEHFAHQLTLAVREVLAEDRQEE